MKRGKTVRELIEELQKLDQEACIWIAYDFPNACLTPEIDVFCKGGTDADDCAMPSRAENGDYFFQAW